MGWSWPFSSNSSASPTDDQNESSIRGIGLTEEQRIRIFGRPSPSATSSSDTTRKSQEDSDIDAFIKSFSASDASKSEATPQVIDRATPTQHEEPPKQKTFDRTLPDGSLNISPEVMYPRTMSCRAQFDQAFYCQSLGGKFNDIYRYGHIKSCSEQWGAFWFCMRTNNLSTEEREEQIQEYYKLRDERRRLEHGSSEDVWEVRRVAVKRAFWRDPDKEGEEGMVKE